METVAKEKDKHFTLLLLNVKEAVSEFRSSSLRAWDSYVLATETPSPRLRRPPPPMYHLEDPPLRTTDLRFARHVAFLCRKLRGVNPIYNAEPACSGDTD